MLRFSFSVRKRSRQCENTRISVVKTIRLTLSGVHGWLEKHPSMKVVHLIRDPRPQFQSQLEAFGQNWCRDVKMFCRSVEGGL